MKPEEIYTLSDLQIRYGEEFDWQEIGNQNESFIHELNLELDAKHPLFEKAVSAIARRLSQDDLLYLMDDQTYAIVHLTYARHNTSGYPRFSVFTNLQEVLSHIESEYLEEFGIG